ncbi:reverse transcriptase domain, reverse transcriptase zinc-binding domain protein [Tanacetum coccineum]
MEVESPSVVEETMEKEKLSHVVNSSDLGSFPPIPTQETTLAGNAPEDVGTVLVWVKLFGVPVTAFSEDGLSAIVTKLELKDNIVAAMPKINGESYYTCNIRVKYKWKPPRCASCKVFGHVQDECPKNTGTGEMMNMKKISQIPKGFSVGQKMGFKPKQVYQPVSKKTTANTSANTKKNVDPPKEVTNPFEVLTSVENDEELGTNGGASNLASKATNSSGSSFWNAESSSPSTTPIIEKINEMENLIIDGKAILVDNEGKPLGKVDEDSEDEVASDDNEMAGFLAKRDGYGTQSLLEQ